MGSPANLYDSLNGSYVYVGQVEQQYQNCGGGVVNGRAHFQWAGSYQSANPGAWVNVWQHSPYSFQTGSNWFQTYTKNAYSYPVEIHHASPDTWQARATLDGCSSYAEGTSWFYGTGTPEGGTSYGYCH